MKQKLLILLVAGLALSAPAGAATVLFQLDPPNGTRGGIQWTTVGWGFSVSTDAGYVSIENITFDETPGLQVGDFTAYIPSSVADPLNAITSPFTAGSSGLQYDIWLTAPVGAASIGTMTLTYDWSPDDPNMGDADYGLTTTAKWTPSGGVIQDVMAEVDVSGPSTATPEPAGFVLAGTALAAIALWARRRRAQL